MNLKKIVAVSALVAATLTVAAAPASASVTPNSKCTTLKCREE